MAGHEPDVPAVVLAYDRVVPERPEREARLAQAAYLGQAERVLEAIRRLAELQVVLIDEQGGVPAWTPQQLDAVRTCAKTWYDLAARRRDYDDVRRHLAKPESWPHA
jgi:hypothetical protein